jgi:hypothetical protein
MHILERVRLFEGIFNFRLFLADEACKSGSGGGGVAFSFQKDCGVLWPRSFEAKAVG